MVRRQSDWTTLRLSSGQTERLGEKARSKASNANSVERQGLDLDQEFDLLFWGRMGHGVMLDHAKGRMQGEVLKETISPKS